MTYWAQLLHFYQPPTQTHDILTRVANESYRPLLAVLKEQPLAKLAVNMNGVLTEMLLDHGLGDVVDSLREVAERGQIEFVGSGKFHPILPLIPHAMAERAIQENAASNGTAFGECWRPRGFFPPELCFGPGTAEQVASAGQQWVILSGVGCPTAWPIDEVPRIEAGATTIAALFRDDSRSNRISFRETRPAEFIDDLSRVGDGAPAYVLTAMDAETYGHHIRGWEREFLAATYELIGSQTVDLRPAHSRVEVVMPSALVDLFPAGSTVSPLASSWSTSREDISGENPYPLWKSPGNAVHELQWQYVDHALGLVDVAQRGASNESARKFAQIADEKMQPALHSCQFWWASRRPMWDVPMVHRGLLLLSEVILFASKSIGEGRCPASVKQEAAWRLAAANETRGALERELLGTAP
ncbi:MAG: hypothetical protein ABIP13_09105 [Tepidiformaceae bacterium]